MAKVSKSSNIVTESLIKGLLRDARLKGAPIRNTKFSDWGYSGSDFGWVSDDLITDIIAFEPDLVFRLHERLQKGSLPAGSQFIAVRFCRELMVALRIPGRMEGYRFVCKLSRTLTQRSRGYPDAKRRRELLLKQDYYHTDADIQTLWEIQNGRCYYTGAILGSCFADGMFHIDHLEPLAWGGHDGPTNLALVTAKTNTSKGYWTSDEYIKRSNLPKVALTRMKRIDQARRKYFAGIDRLKKNRSKMRKSRQRIG